MFAIEKNKELDSTWTDRRKANNRLSNLRNSTRGKKVEIVLIEVPDDSTEYPKNYRNPSFRRERY